MVKIINAEFVTALRGLAEVLRPLASCEPVPIRSTEWKHVWTEPEPYALAWWSALLTVADLLELPSCAITTGQIDYLRSQLFGDTPAVAAFPDRLMHHSHLIEIRGKSYRLHEHSLAARSRKAKATA